MQNKLCRKIPNSDKKENEIANISGNSDGIGYKVINEEGLPNIGGNAQIFNQI